MAYYQLAVCLLISVFLILEVVWLARIYKVKETDFINQINFSIREAIDATNIIAQKHSKRCFYLDLTKEKRITGFYHKHGSQVNIDTTSNQTKTILNKIYYDLRDKTWSLDTINKQFHILKSLPLSSIAFVRTDSSGKVIDQYPTHLKLTDSSTFPAYLLGNIDKHYLTAYYDYPIRYFLAEQKTGLIISLIPLLVILYYLFLLIRHSFTDRYNNRLIEEQTIGIHDLKTPLCTNRDIESRVAQNLYNWPIEKIREKLHLTHQQSIQLLGSIQKLMQRSVVSWGGKVEKQSFDLKKAIEDVIDSLTADHAEVRIRLDFKLTDPMVCADPFHLTHVVGNLIGNAIKHSNEQVNVRVICESTTHGQLLLSVEDNGPGMAPEVLRNIFRKGYHSSHPKQQNHGLGLAYVHKIVRHYKGNLRVESKMGQGTVFRILLNLKSSTHKTDRFSYLATYNKIYIGMLIAEVVWMVNLYSTEREDFRRQQGEFITKARHKVTSDALRFRDTAKFINNKLPDPDSVTVIRGRRKVIVPLNKQHGDYNIYGRIYYDLRDSTWLNVHLNSYYRKLSKNTLPIVFTRTDSIDYIIDQFPAEEQRIAFPLMVELPLGYVEGHRLKAVFAFPWYQPLVDHQMWLIFSGISILLAGMLAIAIRQLVRREEELKVFQQEKLQRFIRNLEFPLLELSQTESLIIHQINNEQLENITQHLIENSKIFASMLIEINSTLDQLVRIKHYQPILMC